jgi:transcriptional regulator with XRE-family HTH domain
VPQSDPPPNVLDARRQVGDRIRDLRAERGLSQIQLAHAAGIGRESVYRAELGSHSVGLDKFILMAEALGVPLWRLFRDE